MGEKGFSRQREEPGAVEGLLVFEHAEDGVQELTLAGADRRPKRSAISRSDWFSAHRGWRIHHAVCDVCEPVIGMRRSAMKVVVFAFVACLMVAMVAKAHQGGLDDLGCHYTKSRSEYHCHRGWFAGRTFRSKAEAKREADRLHLPKPAKKKRTK